MLVPLELLAPAKNAEIGIAAIDCGADAVYIAGPSFGARKSAGNSIEDIKSLCDYAHKFGAKIFITFNTILFDNELDEAKKLLQDIDKIEVDAIIVQDLAVIQMCKELNISIPLHASTQCAIQSPEDAVYLENIGFSRLVLERAMSIKKITEIRKKVNAELEFFVHGALCVCYSGQCYISEYLTGRSANRGNCVQACRARYDLVDAKGKVIVKNKALLSLKDYNLLGDLENLADAGICSFKIEGRLKNISYVKNVVRQYSMGLDRLIDKYPDKYCRASFGKVTQGFNPDLNKTFNRGYTSLFIYGKRGKWASLDTPKGMGEEIGTVSSIKKTGKDEIEILITPHDKKTILNNGDGFSFYTEKDIIGFRGDICNGFKIRTKKINDIFINAKIFRNLNTLFEKQIVSNACVREINVIIDLDIIENDSSILIKTHAISEDNRVVNYEISTKDIATNPDRILNALSAQLSKRSGIYSFTLRNIYKTDNCPLPFLNIGTINEIRRELAQRLDNLPCNKILIRNNHIKFDSVRKSSFTYKQNISNKLAYNLAQKFGGENIEAAYEISHKKGVELMRTKYCIKYELGICPVYHKNKDNTPLFLLNNGRRFPLKFDCKKCEMIVGEAEIL